MNLNLYQIISLILLVLIFITSYYLIRKIQYNKSKFQQRKITKTLLTNERQSNLQKFNKIIDIRKIEEQAHLYGFKFSYKRIVFLMLVGAIVGVLITYLYFNRFFFLSPVLAVLMAYVFIQAQLQSYRKKYLIALDNSIQIYLSTMATAIATFKNLNAALENIIPSISGKLKEDLLELQLMVQDGKNIKSLLDDLSSKYPIHEFKHFNDQLNLIIETGDYNSTSLITIANKMQKKKKYRKQIGQAHKANKKTWQYFIVMILLLPFLFFVGMNDFYSYIRDSYIVYIAYLIAFSYIYYSWKKLEELQIYDPTTDRNKI